MKVSPSDPLCPVVWPLARVRWKQTPDGYVALIERHRDLFMQAYFDHDRKAWKARVCHHQLIGEWKTLSAARRAALDAAYTTIPRLNATLAAARAEREATTRRLASELVLERAQRRAARAARAAERRETSISVVERIRARR